MKTTIFVLLAALAMAVNADPYWAISSHPQVHPLPILIVLRAEIPLVEEKEPSASSEEGLKLDGEHENEVPNVNPRVSQSDDHPEFIIMRTLFGNFLILKEKSASGEVDAESVPEILEKSEAEGLEDSHEEDPREETNEELLRVKKELPKK